MQICFGKTSNTMQQLMRNRLLFANKILFAIIVLLLSSSSLSAQTVKDNIKIKGIILDSLTLEEIGYATVALMGDSSKMTNAVPSDVNGKFTIKAPRQESYKIVVGFLGYGTKVIPVQGISPEEDEVVLDTVFMTQGVTLETVQVVAQKPLITSTADKLTYNMDADPESATSSTQEILRKVPMISIDGNDDVRLNGETNYKVLINGRSSTMMSKNFKEVIKSLPASSIKNIEVITNPSTKYESEGIGGIINIITSKQQIRGFNGSVNVGVDNRGGVNTGLYIAGQIGKFAISTNLGFGEYINIGSESKSKGEYFNSDEYKYSEGHGDSGRAVNNNGHASIEASYEIDSLNLITLSGWGYLGDYKSDSESSMRFFDVDNNLTREYRNVYDSSNGYGGTSVSLNYQKLFMKKDRSLTFSYNLDNSPSDTFYESEIDGVLNYDSYKQRSENDSYTIEHSAQIDFYSPINDKHQYEAGVKYVLRQNVSDTDVNEYNYDTEEWEGRPEKVNDLDYDQHTGGFYGGYVFKHKKFTAKAGFRGELTFNEGVSKSHTGNVKLETDPVMNFIPYVNLSYNLGKGQNLYGSYTQRIQRPSIWYLNPYVNDLDPFDISTGNPDLEPVLANTFSLSYRKSSQKWTISVRGSASLADNSILRVSTVDSEGVKTSTYDNIGTNNNYTLYPSISFRLGQKLSIYANGSVTYSNLSSDKNDLANSGFRYGASIGGNVQLWKDASCYINYGSYSSYINLQGTSSGYSYHSIGLTQRLLKKKMGISISASNPFVKYRSRESLVEDTTFRTYSTSDYVQQSFRISVNYRFGKMAAQVKKARRTINNDDKMSGGGAGASTGGDSN